MKQSWFYNVLPIAVLYAFRMSGLFMIIPVFSVYAIHLSSATPMLIGIALGSYGLTQGLLQIPFGMLSDRFGRKPILTLGLLLFIIGSFIGAITHSIYGMIFARIVQGAGAIGSVLIALLADLTTDRQRTKAMAMIGATMGLSFSFAMIISPILTNKYGLNGLFLITTGLGVCGLLLLYFFIATPQHNQLQKCANLALFSQVIRNPYLQTLNIGIFFQHLILTATFFAIPIALQHQMKIGHLDAQWHFYLPIMLLAFIFMLPFIILGEKKQRMQLVFMGSIALTGLCQFALIRMSQSWFGLTGLMLSYFVAFNILEASLPSLISKQAEPNTKGTAMGIYSSSQFLGIFTGGSLSGLIYQFAGCAGIFFINGIICLLWLYIMRNKLGSKIFINK